MKKDATDAHYVSMGRWCTIVGVLVSIGTAYLVMQFLSIMDYVQALFSFFIAPLFGTVLLGMLWKRCDAPRAASGACWPAPSPPSPCGPGSRPTPRRCAIIALSPDAKDMAENMYRALWSWIICVASPASSSRCPTSATNAPSPKRFAWPASTCPCWFRPRPTRPADDHRRPPRQLLRQDVRCNNLKQYGIPYSLTTLHTECPIRRCSRRSGVVRRRLPRGQRACASLRVGAIGARPGRVQHRPLQREDARGAGIDVEPIDLSEILGRIERMKDDHDAAAQASNSPRSGYVSTEGVPEASLMKMAKLGAVIDGWMKETDGDDQRRAVLDGDRGVLRRRALHRDEHDERRADVERLRGGRLRRHRHARAARWPRERPRALLDWNNNYGDDPDKAVCFHCSNLPKHFLQDVRMDYQEIIAGTVGKLNTFGTCVGRVKSGPMTFARFSTDDGTGDPRLRGRRRVHRRSAETFGGAGVVRIPGCRRCCATSARTASSTTLRRTSSVAGEAVCEAASTTSAGTCTGTASFFDGRVARFPRRCHAPFS
jgi:hypothetical protein